MNTKTPSWVPYKINLFEIDDEAALLQLGQSEQSEFYQLQYGSIKPSSETDDLIEKPDGFYKMGSCEVIINNSKMLMNRETYSLLDWLGDVGGLNDALKLIV